MKINKFIWVLFFSGFFLFSFILIAGADILNIEMSPGLDISRFAPYKIKADISGSPTSVSVEINAINGDNPDPNCWDYFIDGACGSAPVVKDMTYNSLSGKWESQNIYPDNIYPEIYFANSETTWYNAPSNLTMSRNSYQLFNFSNPFTMTDGMSFYVEFNAVPRATNSADLQVYLVKKDTPITFFNSDWRSSPSVSLVGNITKDDVISHTHTANSVHHLVALTAGADGTVNGLDISNNFWVVLYSSSPNNARGWDLRYHSTAVDGCSDAGRWYQGSQSGWSTTAMSGCPDSHIHIARRITDINTTIQDGVRAQITANYASGGPTVTTQDYYFVPLINLAPNSTSFINPSIGGNYNENITVGWNPATDPNNDPLLYSIYLLNSDNQVISTLVSATSTTSFIWDIGAVSSGTYSLKGVITEDISPNPLSTEFFLGGNFVIDKEAPLYTLSSINLSSNNASSTLAKAGNVVTLSITATGTTTPTINFYSGGNPVMGDIIINPTSGSSFNATYTVHIDDTSGPVSFDISASNLAQIYDDTTDSSNVLVDVISPAAVVASPVAGTYNSSQVVSLSSAGADYIKYTTNETVPTCATGSLYVGALNINAPSTIKALACDNVGNFSVVSTFEYAFQYAVTFNGNGGSGHAPASQLVSHGATTTLPTAPTRPGYTFNSWNTQVNGLGTSFDTTTVVNSNLTVYAIWDINSYTLTYNGNSETSGAAHPLENHNYNIVVTIKNENTLLKTGYAFYGWNTQADGSGISYSTGDSLAITESITLYAQWLELTKCTVTFNGNGGSGHVPGTKTFVCDSPTSLNGAGLVLPTNPTRSGYVFNSWNMQADGNGSNFTVDTAVSTNITVFAQWTGNNYNLNFNAQGGNVSPTSTSVVYNNAVGSLPTPTRANYTFTSWNTQADGGGASYNSGTVYTVVGDTTLFAQWTGNNYNLNFNAQGGNVSPTSTSVVYNNAVGSLPAPTKSGYTFTSWNTQADGGGASYSSSTIYQTSGDLTLYAQWQANNYQIAFNSQFGSVVYNKAVTFNSPVGVLETPTRSGYIFSGWFTESNGDGVEYTSSTIYTTAGNKFLIAYWTLEPEEEVQLPINNSGSTVSLPPGIGSGARDATVTAGVSIGSNVQVGEITSAGVNVLTYITNINYFIAPQSSSNWDLVNHNFQITSLDLLYNKVEIDFYSQPNIINLNLGESRDVDLDGDGISDISVTFSSLYVNRAEITIKALSELGSKITKEEESINYELVVKKERDLTLQISSGLTNRLAGRLLLQVEEKGQAWYLDPVSKQRFFMGRPHDAFDVMRHFGLGISEDNFAKFEKSGAPARFAGRIILRVEANGEAYYINPTDMGMHYLGRPVDAFNLMRDLALGISNENIRQITVGEVK